MHYALFLEFVQLDEQVSFAAQFRPKAVKAMPGIALDGYTCLRYGSESDGFLDVDGGIDRSCRGGSENDNNPSHYTVLDQKTQQQCKQLCRENMACVGIEHAGTRVLDCIGSLVQHLETG